MRSYYLYCSFLFFFLPAAVSAGIETDTAKVSLINIDDSRPRGFYWYDDETLLKPVEKVEEEPESIQIPEPQKQAETIEKLTYNQLWVMDPDLFAKELDRRQKFAIQFPTVENVYSYLEVQDVAKRKSVAFAGVMGYVSQLNPQFAGENHYPINVPGQNVYRSEGKNEDDEFLGSAKNDFALLEFVSDGCAYCKAQEPILNMFIASHGWNIKTIDIAEYPDLVNQYSITMTPSILVISKETQKAIPLTS